MRKTFFFLALGLLVAMSANAVEKKVYSYYNSSTKTLTFTYDDQYDSRSNVEYYTGSSDRRFSGYETEVTSIVVDQSLETLHRASWARLFYAGGSGTTEYHLSKVTSITGLQYIKTDLATDLTGMFNGLESIESIDVSTFNTSKVQSTSWLFGSCKKLKTINLGDMDITALTNTTFMFGYCSALEKIYCTTNFSASTTLSTSTSMFYATSKLVGGNGTKYVSSKQDKAYARPDGGTAAPGYFTAPKKVYTEYVDATKTLTYYCDDLYPTREGIVEIYDPNNYSYRFDGYNTKVLTIDIDESMADTSLTKMVYFFSSYNYQLVNATSIKHLEYINTTKTENVDAMFYGLQSITSLDISSFETQNMTVMAHMFSDCVKMTSLRLGGNFNTAKVTSLREMLTSCMALKAIDCTNMDVTKVTDVCRMFADNAALVTIWCNTDWSVLTNITNWGDTFRACTALKGGKGTTFNSSYIKNQYARPDGGPESETPGYFTPTSVLQDIKDEVYESLNALKKGENTKVDEIINAAKSEVNAYVWDLTMTYDENVADFNTEFSYSWYMDVKTAVQNQYELDQNLEKLYAAIADLTALRMFADNYLENAEIVASINTDINNAYAVYNNPSATLAEVNTALKNATDAIESYKALMMPMAKEQLKADLNAILKEGDPQACKDIVAAAVAQVDEIIVWDKNKTVTENILALAAAGETLYNTTKAAVEDARKETGIDAIIGSAVKDAKIIRNGQLYIIRDGKTFNANGAQVR